jgi:hypothetical protein
VAKNVQVENLGWREMRQLMPTHRAPKDLRGLEKEPDLLRELSQLRALPSCHNRYLCVESGASEGSYV